MALVKKSTWRQMRHDAGLWARDLSDSLNNMLQFENVNGGINDSMREDIPYDETEAERLDREEREREDREREEQEEQDRIDQEREDQEREWQEEQDKLLEKESNEPGAWQKAWDKFKESSFYEGYRNTRNALVGGAVVGAGLGITSGGAGLAIAAAPGAIYAGKELKNWVDRKLDAYRERQADVDAGKTQEGAVHEAEERLRKAEAQAAVGVSEDQRQKAEPGSVAYNNIKAKERTVDQKIQEQEALLDGARSGKVDPAFVQASAEGLVAGLEQPGDPGLQFGMR